MKYLLHFNIEGIRYGDISIDEGFKLENLKNDMSNLIF